MTPVGPWSALLMRLHSEDPIEPVAVTGMGFADYLVTHEDGRSEVVPFAEVQLTDRHILRVAAAARDAIAPAEVAVSVFTGTPWTHESVPSQTLQDGPGRPEAAGAAR